MSTTTKGTAGDGDPQGSNVIELIKVGNREAVERWFSVNKTGDFDTMIECEETELHTISSTFTTLQRTALHYAAFFGQTEIVKFLLDKGADPAHVNDQQENALHAALDCNAGDRVVAEVVKLMLDRSASFSTTRYDATINAISDAGFTPLLVAVYLDLKETVRVLLDNGADPTVETSNETLFIFGLAAEKDGDVLEMLLRHNKVQQSSYKLSEKLNAQYGDRGFTPLHHATLHSQRRSVELLVQNGADCRVNDLLDNYPIHYTSEALREEDFEGMVVQLKTSVDDQDSTGYTILHLTVLHNKVEFTSILRKEHINANFNVEDKKGRLPLHYLCEHRGNEQLVHLLADSHSLQQPDHSGHTPLHYAVQENDHDLVKTLLRAKARAVDPLEQLFKGRTSIHIAVISKKGNDADFERMLSVFKANMKPSEFAELLNMKAESDGTTALILAIKKQKFRRAKSLLSNKADASIQDHSGRNCLHHAFLCDAPASLVVTILEKCEDTKETRDRHQNVPLQYLTKHTPLEAVRAMKDIKVEEDSGSTSDPERKEAPLVEAVKLKRTEVVKLLLVNGATFETKALKDVIAEGDNKLAGILVRHADMNNLKAVLNKVIPTPSHGGKQEEATSVAEHRSKKDDSHTTLFRELVQHMPDVAMEALERCVSVDRRPRSGSVTFDYCFIRPPLLDRSTEAKAKTMRQALIDPVKLMVDAKRTSLLQHPVVGSYLHAKWNSHGVKRYVFDFLLYALFLFCLTAFALTVNSPLSSTCTQQKDSKAKPCGFPATSYLFAAIVVVLAGGQLFKKLTSLKSATPSGIQTLLELLLFPLSVVFVFVFFLECGCPHSLQWQIGIVAVFLGWANLMFRALCFPTMAVPVATFCTLVAGLAKIVLFAFFLVTAFSVVLFMMFHNPATKISSFISAGNSFLTTLTMITGVSNFDSLFSFDASPSESLPMSYYTVNFFMWTIFLVLIPIIFNNMLISQAVGMDMHKIRQAAELKRLLLQVRFCHKAELFGVVGKDVDASERTVVLKREMWHDRLSFLVWGGRNYLQDVKDSTYEQRRQEERAEICEAKAENKLDVIRERQEELFDLVQSLQSSLLARN